MAYEELKARQSVVWGNGPYQRITEMISDLHDQVIERLAPARGSAGSTSPAGRVRWPNSRRLAAPRHRAGSRPR